MSTRTKDAAYGGISPLPSLDSALAADDEHERRVKLWRELDETWMAMLAEEDTMNVLGKKRSERLSRLSRQYRKLCKQLGLAV